MGVIICDWVKKEVIEPTPHRHHQSYQTVRIVAKVFNPGLPWWRHQIETFSALLALCAGNSPEGLVIERINPFQLAWSETNYRIYHHLAVITGTAIAVPYLYVNGKSLQIIWRSDIRRWNIRELDLQMNCRDLTIWQGTERGLMMIICATVVARLHIISIPYYVCETAYQTSTKMRT